MPGVRDYITRSPPSVLPLSTLYICHQESSYCPPVEYIIHILPGVLLVSSRRVHYTIHKLPGVFLVSSRGVHYTYITRSSPSVHLWSTLYKYIHMSPGVLQVPARGVHLRHGP